MSKKKSEKEAKEKKHAGKKASVKSKKAPVAPEAAVVAVAEATPAAKPKAEKPKAAKAAKSAPAKAAPLPICGEDIALRAYFIAERRHKMGWPGDSTSDWVEAERQLKAEAARKNQAAGQPRG